jgi:hypothetical protein
MSKLICVDCGEDLKNIRPLEVNHPPGILFVAHCDNRDCFRKWELVDVTRRIVVRDISQVVG